MLTPGYNTCWEQFASTKWYNEGEFDENSGYMSLEYIHNNIHVSQNDAHIVRESADYDD